MASLVLDSLEIQRFRGFEHLTIERLGRVNLIVGKNNIGKTNLLTVIQLYAKRASSPTFIWEVLENRSEVRRRLVHVNDMLTVLRYLFYGREEIRPGIEPIRIGPVNKNSETLTIAIEWSVTDIAPDGTQQIRPLRADEDYTVEALLPRFSIQINGTSLSYPIDPSLPQGILRLNVKEIPHVYVAAHGLINKQVSTLWDSITLTPLEKEVLDALRFIAPGVKGLNFVNTPLSTGGERDPIVSIASSVEPIPMNSLGDGMQRILEIALALVNARGGVLLIDEFENGLHYSIQPDLWRLIFRVARNLDVQVFATTHSWDCIEAFQKAAEEDTNSEGLLIRLDVEKSGIHVALLNEQMLSVATDQRIEVR